MRRYAKLKLFGSNPLIYYHPTQLDCMPPVQIHIHRYITILYRAIRTYNVVYVRLRDGKFGCNLSNI